MWVTGPVKERRRLMRNLRRASGKGGWEAEERVGSAEWAKHHVPKLVRNGLSSQWHLAQRRCSVGPPDMSGARRHTARRVDRCSASGSSRHLQLIRRFQHPHMPSAAGGRVRRRQPEGHATPAAVAIEQPGRRGRRGSPRGRTFRRRRVQRRGAVRRHDRLLLARALAGGPPRRRPKIARSILGEPDLHT